MERIENILGYEVHRKNVKNINIRIRKDLTIYISAPLNLDSYFIENFIVSKKKWIDDTINRLDKLKKEFTNTYGNNGNVKFLGKNYSINHIESNKNLITINNDTFNIYSKNCDIEKIIEKFYYENAKKIFSELINKNLEKMKLDVGENISKLKINKSKTKWGYCIPAKRIIFLNIELIKRSLFEIEYVIIHELSHLKVPNHSKQFYHLVEKYMKDYKKAEELLKGKLLIS